MDIKIGEYVRTNKGNIGKVIEKRIGRNIDDTSRKEYLTIYMLNTGLWTITQYIIKHSKNIIDLIEVRRLREWLLSNSNR